MPPVGRQPAQSAEHIRRQPDSTEANDYIPGISATTGTDALCHQDTCMHLQVCITHGQRGLYWAAMNRYAYGTITWRDSSSGKHAPANKAAPVHDGALGCPSCRCFPLAPRPVPLPTRAGDLEGDGPARGRPGSGAPVGESAPRWCFPRRFQTHTTGYLLLTRPSRLSDLKGPAAGPSRTRTTHARGRDAPGGPCARWLSFSLGSIPAQEPLRQLQTPPAALTALHVAASGRLGPGVA